MSGLRAVGLSVTYPTDRGPVHAVRGVDVAVERGTRVGLVGESGSGKTTIAAALLGLLPSGCTVEGEIELGGEPIDPADERRWRGVRGRQIAAVPQGAMAGLHPAYRVERQVAEVITVHTDARRGEAERRARELLAGVGLDERAARAFPHELSGGMRQRVALAAGLACAPDVLIADEPTVGLDSVTAAGFLDLLLERQATDGFGLLLVSHDLRAVHTACDRLLVAYAGEIVEDGPTPELVGAPHHPYSIGLLAAAPSLGGSGWSAIPGRAPNPAELSSGCSFIERCPRRHDTCRHRAPRSVELGARRVSCHLYVDGPAEPVDVAFPMVHRVPVDATVAPVVDVRGVSKRYRARRGWRTIDVPALTDVDVSIAPGEIVGLVGPSGSGKSTLARSLFGLVQVDDGSIVVGGNEIVGMARRELRRIRRRLALVHQDPYASLHPAMPVRELVAEPLAIAGVGRVERAARAVEAVRTVGLDPDATFLARRAGQLSGGQRQRIALARALVVDPLLVVLDEPMSMLDASVRAGIAQALIDARDTAGLAALVITHDLAEAAATCDRLIVLDAGRIVEAGPSERLAAAPQHPATRRLFQLAQGTVAPAEVPRAVGA